MGVGVVVGSCGGGGVVAACCAAAVVVVVTIIIILSFCLKHKALLITSLVAGRGAREEGLLALQTDRFQQARANVLALLACPLACL